MLLLQQSEATAAQRRWFFHCVDDTDGKTPETGLTFSGAELQVSENGAAFANFTGTATELADGLYYYEAHADELSTLGALAFKIEKTGVRTTTMQVAQVVPWDPYDAVRQGMTALPNAAAGAVSGLPVLRSDSPSGEMYIDGNDQIAVSVLAWNGTAVATPTVAGVPEVDVTHWIGTAAATPTVAGVPEVDATYWRGGLIVAPTTTGTPNVTTVAMAANSIGETTLTTAARAKLRGVLHRGVVEGASSSSVTLAVAGTPLNGAPTNTTNDTLKGCWVSIIDDELGGVSEVRLITAYNGTTRVATVAPNWRVTPPVNGESYEILPAAAIDVGMWLNTVAATPTVAGVPEIDVTHWNGTAVATPTTAGVPRVDVKAMEANTLTASALATDAVTEIQAGLATAAALTIVDDFLDTEVAAIVAATDTLEASFVTAQADLDDIQTRLPAALVGGRMDSSVGAMAADVLTAAALATDAVTEITDAIFAYVVENSKTFLHYIRIMKSAIAGKAAGYATGTRTYRDDADTKARITATVDSTGRTAVTVDGT